jgi:dCTP deaminase
MFLSDADYRREFGHEIQIDPVPDDVQMQPASIDLRLGDEFLTFFAEETVLDVARAGLDDVVYEHRGDTFILRPGAFVLATTLETVTLGPAVLARVEGRSSLGRLGLAVHITAGFIDPGFSGKITLELYNHNPNAICLRKGMRICQIVFGRLESPCLRPYAGKYQNQSRVEPSRLYADVEQGS